MKESRQNRACSEETKAKMGESKKLTSLRR